SFCAERQKAEVPDAVVQARAMELVKEVFGPEFKEADTPEKRAALAGKLIGQARASRDMTEKYAILTIAKSTAIVSGDARTAFRAVAALSNNFEVDALSMKVGVSKQVAGASRTTAQRKAIAGHILGVIEEAVGAEDYESAQQLAKIARSTAVRARDGTLVKRIVARSEEVEAMARAYAEMQKSLETLEESPIDPAANLACGRYYCLMKKDWGKGIPMLALGSDAGLREVAIKELKVVRSIEARIALGDAWWELAEQKEDMDKISLQSRAADWYKLVLPKVTGLVKTKIEKRMKESPASRPEKPIPVEAKLEVRLRFVLRGHTSQVLGLAFSSDGLTLASCGGPDRSLRIWNTRNGKALQTCGNRAYQSLAFSPNAPLIASGMKEGPIHLSDAVTGHVKLTLESQSTDPAAVAFSPDGGILASGSFGGSALRIWNVNTGKAARIIRGYGDIVHAVSFSPDGSRLAFGAGRKGGLYILDVGTGKVRQTFEGHTNLVMETVFTPDGSTLVSGSRDTTIKFWNARTGKLNNTWRVNAWVNDPYRGGFFALAPNGSIIAYTDCRGQLCFKSVTTGETLASVDAQTGRCLPVRFSPDGQTVATGGVDSLVKLWDVMFR
ncbi:WD40 repeat domain-containing protein, partial [Planctomycetota bacterium]